MPGFITIENQGEGLEPAGRLRRLLVWMSVGPLARSQLRINRDE